MYFAQIVLYIKFYLFIVISKLPILIPFIKWHTLLMLGGCNIHFFETLIISTFVICIREQLYFATA